MAGIEEILARLAADPEFRALLRDDPRAALSGYMLYDEDLDALAVWQARVGADTHATEPDATDPPSRNDPHDGSL